MQNNVIDIDEHRVDRGQQCTFYYISVQLSFLPKTHIRPIIISLTLCHVAKDWLHPCTSKPHPLAIYWYTCGHAFIGITEMASPTEIFLRVSFTIKPASTTTMLHSRIYIHDALAYLLYAQRRRPQKADSGRWPLAPAFSVASTN